MAIENKSIFDALIYLKTSLPLEAMDIISKTPKIGSKAQRDRVKTLKRLTEKMNNMQDVFYHFMNKKYVYETKQSDLIWSKMNE
jgi:hypothetical protein